MDYDEIKKLTKILEESSLKKIFIKNGDKEIELEKESQHSAPMNVTSQCPSHSQEIEPSPKVEGHFVKSPMVGTYYSRPAPDQTPYVKVGDNVTADTVVCIIEAMKVMNEVKAGKSGVIKEILLEDGHPVEFSSKMFQIE